MTDDQNTGISIDKLLEQAIDKTNGQVTYANTLSVRIGENEVVLELYFMLPSISGAPAQPSLLQRIVLPLKLGAQLAQMLSNGIAQLEEHNSSSNISDLKK
jgi:hypothetical protein